MWQRILIVTAFCSIWPLALVAAEDDPENDSSAALPKEYAGKYLLAENTLSPDKTIGVIYPKLDLCTEEEDKDCKDYLVQLKPFKILETVKTKWPHFQNKSHGGLGADWRDDKAAALVTLDSKWGPGDIFLYEFNSGQLVRSTNLLPKIHDLLEPDFRKARSARYNDYFDFIFESEDKPMVEFKGSTVQIHAKATTDPKGIPGEKAWDGEVEAVWDIPLAKFTKQRVKRLFAGVRKGQ
jgi:hypothetical protein